MKSLMGGQTVATMAHKEISIPDLRGGLEKKGGKARSLGKKKYNEGEKRRWGEALTVQD